MSMKDEVTEARRKYLLEAALTAAEKKGGFHHLTREVIATVAGVSPPLVSRYLGGMETIRHTIMTEAVAQGRVEIVAQGLTAGHPVAMAASKRIKDQARRRIE